MTLPLAESLAGTEAAAWSISCDDRWLVVALPALHVTASWALVGGGVRHADRIAWHRVEEHELRPPADARALLRERLHQRRLAQAVGLMTSRNLTRYRDVTRGDAEVNARCIATVGLGNALRIGDPPGPAGRIGTINLLCCVSVPLSENGLLETLSLAAEARTAAILRAGISSRRTGLPATGTGTDCIVVAAPVGRPARAYAGKHTRIGHAVGAAVEAAVVQGAQDWQAEQAAHQEPVS